MFYGCRLAEIGSDMLYLAYAGNFIHELNYAAFPGPLDIIISLINCRQYLQNFPFDRIFRLRSGAGYFLNCFRVHWDGVPALSVKIYLSKFLTGGSGAKMVTH